MWKYGLILQFFVANATILIAMYSVGLHETPLRKPLSQQNFVTSITLYMYTQKATIFKQKNKQTIKQNGKKRKKTEKKKYCFKMAAK